MNKNPYENAAHVEVSEDGRVESMDLESMSLERFRLILLQYPDNYRVIVGNENGFNVRVDHERRSLVIMPHDYGATDEPGTGPDDYQSIDYGAGLDMTDEEREQIYGDNPYADYDDDV